MAPPHLPERRRRGILRTAIDLLTMKPVDRQERAAEDYEAGQELPRCKAFVPDRSTHGRGHRYDEVVREGRQRFSGPIGL